MNEEQIFEILSAMKDALDTINHKIEELEEKSCKVDQLEARLENEIIQPTLEKIKQDEDEADFSEFHNKYGEKLDKYSDMLKSIEGDDFDASREAWKAWKEYEAPEGYAKPDNADGYIDAFVSAIEDKIAEIKKGLNLPEDAEVKVVSDGDTVDVEIEGEPVEAEEKSEEKSEEKPEEETEDFSDDEEGKLSEEEIKEIEEFKKDYKGWN